MADDKQQPEQTSEEHAPMEASGMVEEVEGQAGDAQQQDAMIQLLNLAESLNDEELDSMGSELKTQVETDIGSRKEWLDRLENWVELSTQVQKRKTHPWPDASNIKFPLLQTAAVQFHARAFPALLGNTTPVRGKVIGRDYNGSKANRADRVGTYMSYQILYDIQDWVDDMDKNLLALPILGAIYKKTFFNPRTSKPESMSIHPRDFIISYDARDFTNCRKTHRIWKSPNEIKELILRGVYRDFEGADNYEAPKTASESRDKTHGLSNSGKLDPYGLQELYEVHCLLDLDEDGYREPYIVTLRESDGKVFRITTAFSRENVEMTPQGNVMAITPTTYFTPYFFLPDPESKTHGLGFGTMVGPLNEAVNTLINQLTDAGTLSNLQGGFLGRGIRLEGGNMKFKPGEWKQVNNTGDDLRNGIFPMPTQQPSTVLFSLLGTLIDSGRDLTSVQELMVGRNPGQNQPFSTSEMVMEQGLKVFNGIYKRIYRAMSAEFRLLFKVNSQYMDLNKYMEVLDDEGMEIQQAIEENGQAAVMQFLANDWRLEDFDILPTAEPDMVAEVQRAKKAEALMAKVEMGLPINPMAALRRMLEAEQHEDIESLLQMEEPAPDPEVVLREKELEQKDVELSLLAMKVESEVGLNEAKAETLILEGEGKETERMHSQFMKEKENRRKDFEALTSRLKEEENAKKQSREAGAKAAGTTS